MKKWLFFLCYLMLYSCGKHEQPPLLDLHDDDGDLILNEYERDDEKFLHGKKNIKHLYGKINFQYIESFSLSFNNISRIQDQLWRDLTSSRFLPQKNFFHQDPRHLYLNPTAIDSRKFNEYFKHAPNKDVKISVDLSHSKELQKYSLTLVNSNKKKEVSISSTRIYISLQEIKSLIDKKSYLKINFDFNESDDDEIKFKVFNKDSQLKFFNVMTFDHSLDSHEANGSQGELNHYQISKKITFSNLLKLLSIPKAQEINLDDIFLFSHSQDKKWFYKKNKLGDYIFINTTLTQLKWNFFKNHHSQTQEIKRVNGISENSVLLSQENSMKYFLKITTPNHLRRVFQEREIEKVYGKQGGGGRDGNASAGYKCIHTLREVSGQKEIKEDLYNILSSIKLSFHHLREVSLNQWSRKKISKFQDQGETTYHIILEDIPPRTKLHLSETNDKMIVGEIKNSCHKKYYRKLSQPKNISTEKLFSIKLDHYLEKKE